MLVVGDPLEKQSIRELYNKILYSENSGTTFLTSVQIKDPEMVINNLIKGKKERASFSIKNTGNLPLVINRVEAGCGCLHVVWDKNPLAPGEDRKITVEVTPDQTGYFNKNIHLFTNTEEGTLICSIKGIVKEK